MKRFGWIGLVLWLGVLASCAGGGAGGDADAILADAGAEAQDPGGPDDASRADARTEIDSGDGADAGDAEAGDGAEVPVDGTVGPGDADGGEASGDAEVAEPDVPADDGTGDPGWTDDGSVDSGDPDDLDHDGGGDAGPGDPEVSDPGAPDPGAPDPGPVDAGLADPGTVDAGAGDPGGADSGYTGIYAGLESLAGQALVDRLCPLVRVGYVKITYDQTDELMRDDIDQYGGNVREVYTGLWVSNWSGLNKEHTWPQGYFDEGGPEDPNMRSDLYNLFPSDIDYNNRRSSYPFGVVAARLWPLEGDDLGDPACAEDWPGPGSGCFSLLGTDVAGQKVFEPRDGHKGNAARAVFYFALRYGTADCKVRPLTAFDPYGAEHAAATEALLKEWSRLDPPDLHERNRNDRIETYQKVRNPFVDHPEFLERIGFL